MYSKKRQLGNIGELVAIKKLINEGFSILERNYLKKWGEIDIVARGTDGSVHFVEVKAIQRSESSILDVSRDTYMPEENVTREKIHKLVRMVHTWMSEHKYNGEWHIDVMAVELDMKKRTGKCRFIEDIA
jgi:putative endonuclease